MRVEIYKDLTAIHFIRCVTPVPGLGINAGGAGFTTSQAMARCQSEAIERAYEGLELVPFGVRPAGIAAHLDYESARERALHEALETLCLHQIHAEGRMRCLVRIPLLGGRHALGVARTKRGYFCMLQGTLNGEPIAAYSAARTLFGALLKTWEEYRNFQFFRPEGTLLKNYSKAQKLFSAEELSLLRFQFEPRYVYSPDLSALAEGSAERSGRTIVYYYYDPKQKGDPVL